jgi:hypothetical protein
MEHGSLLSYSQKPATCPCPEPDQVHAIPSAPWKSILLLLHLCLGLPSRLFPSGFPTKSLHNLFPVSAKCPAHPNFLFYRPNNISWGVEIIKILVT